MPHRSQLLNPPTSSISPAATENRADHPLRRGAACCARCNIVDKRQSLADCRSKSALSHPTGSRTASAVEKPREYAHSSQFLPGSAQNVEFVVTRSKQTAGEFLPGSRIGQCRARTSIAEPLSNREHELLESSLTHRKQSVASHSNRELSTNPPCGNSHVLIPVPQFLTGSGSQTEFRVTHSKQSNNEILTGTRIAHYGSRSAGLSRAQSKGSFRLRICTDLSTLVAST